MIIIIAMFYKFPVRRILDFDTMYKINIWYQVVALFLRDSVVAIFCKMLLLYDDALNARIGDNGTGNIKRINSVAENTESIPIFPLHTFLIKK